MPGYKKVLKKNLRLNFLGRLQNFIGKLAACRINIFSTAYSKPNINAVRSKVIHKFLRRIFIGFYEACIICLLYTSDAADE